MLCDDLQFQGWKCRSSSLVLMTHPASVGGWCPENECAGQGTDRHMGG